MSTLKTGFRRTDLGLYWIESTLAEAPQLSTSDLLGRALMTGAGRKADLERFVRDAGSIHCPQHLHGRIRDKAIAALELQLETAKRLIYRLHENADGTFAVVSVNGYVTSMYSTWEALNERGEQIYCAAFPTQGDAHAFALRNGFTDQSSFGLQRELENFYEIRCCECSAHVSFTTDEKSVVMTLCPKCLAGCAARAANLRHGCHGCGIEVVGAGVVWCEHCEPTEAEQDNAHARRGRNEDPPAGFESWADYNAALGSDQ